MENKEPVNQANSNSDLDNLTDTELEYVTGGMQNQLNSQGTVAAHPGGVNVSLNSNLAKVAILCNALSQNSWLNKGK